MGNNIFEYALFDYKKQKFISYNPINELYFCVKDLKQLKIWDVWDEKMIPFILKERNIPPDAKIKKLNSDQIRTLTFIKQYEEVDEFSDRKK